MLVSSLLKSILRFLLPAIVPDEGGGATPPAAAPAADAPAPDAAAPATPEATAAPAAAPAADAKPEPADRLSGLTKALDAISTPEPTPTPTPAPTAAPKPDAKEPEVKPEAKKDDIDLTPPEGTSERGKERWNQLVERAKQVPDLERKFTETATQLQSVRELVNGSGLTAPEFTDFMETARLFKAGDPQALKVLDGLRADLAQRLGVEVPGVDLLANHADLKADVESMTLTKERALEIARGRGAEKRLQGLSDEDRDLDEHKKTITTAGQEMQTVLESRAGTAGHEHRIKVIAEHFQNPEKLKEFVNTYQPKQWKAAVLWMYDNIAVPAQPGPGPQPLRPTNARAGAPVRTGPVTAESSVEGAFARLGM
jgi:hypothetical protein